MISNPEVLRINEAWVGDSGRLVGRAAESWHSALDAIFTTQDVCKHWAPFFDKEATQEHIYELCGRSAVADVLNGHSACVLVYGQTGAGKTHSM